MSDSDGDDAMAYFLPNGIADDSPPKRSTVMPSTSFGPIGATRFGGIYGSGTSATAATPSPTTPAPLYGSLGDPLGKPTTSTTTPNFLLSDLGGEILQSRGNETPSHAIGGNRNPFAFSGAFASLSTAETESRNRPMASSLHSGGIYDTTRNELVRTPTNASPAPGFRNDSEIFGTSSTSGVYGRPTLNANAPAFMATSTPEKAPFGSSSPSAWPTMNVKPRRAPPGLSKPTENPSSPLTGTSESSTSLSLPPGLSHPSQTSTFGGYASPSMFSGEGVRQFASKLRPSFPSLSDTFRSGASPSNQEFTSALSELNAKSMSVEEIQSNLKAVATAAAHDVVLEEPSTQNSARLSTPRSTVKSPRRGVEFRSPATADEKRGGEQIPRASTDPRSRTPTRRHDSAVSSASPGGPSPTTGTRGAGDRRGRNGRDQTTLEGSSRTARPTPSDSNSKSGRRTRGSGQGSGTESRPTHRSGQRDATISTIPIPTTRTKKPPSSVSSVGSDDQLVTVPTTIEVAGESSEAQLNVKELQRESKPTSTRTSNAKKSPAQHNEKRGAQKRQVYREKVVVPDTPKNEIVEAKNDDDNVPGGSDADASGADSQTDENVEDDTKITPSKAETLRVIKSSKLIPPSDDGQATPPPRVRGATPEPTPVQESQPTDTSENTIPESAKSVEPTTTVPTDLSSEKKAVKTEVLESAPTAPSAVEKKEDNTARTPDSPREAASSSEREDDKTMVPESPRPATSRGPPSTLSQMESDSGSEIPEVHSRAVRTTGLSDRKTSVKEHKKEKKTKTEKKRTTASKTNKKEKRESSSSGKGDLAEDEPFVATPAKKPSVVPRVKIASLFRDGRVLLKRGVVSIWTWCVFVCTEFADRINLKGFLAWSFSYLESFLAVVFSVILLLSLHGASFFIRLHRVAFRAVLTHRHVGFCFAFLYAFPFLVQYVFTWAPPWAPVCLWYAFLVQLFCTSGPSAMVATFRIILPLVFLIEGISHHSFLLDLNGAELLLASFILSAMKTSNLCSPIFLISLAVQCLSAVFLGSELVVQWFQMTLALYSLHAMAATDEDWAGLGDEEEELSCRPLSMHHSIADYNYHPAPSAPSIQKTKRLDRRALAYVRGRKLR